MKRTAAQEPASPQQWRRASVCLVLLFACGSPEPSDGTSLEPQVIGQDEIHIVGTSDSLARIVDLMPTASGMVWVLNNAAPFLILLSARGEELTVHGDIGGGPGEYSWPSTLVRDPSTGAIWAYDTGWGRLTRLPEGADLGETRSLAGGSSAVVRLNSYEYLWTNNGGRAWIEGTEDGFVFAEPAPGLPWIFSLWSTEVVRLPTGGEPERILSTAEVIGDPAARFPGVQRFLPYPIWTACPSGTLAMYDPSRNLLRRFSPTGDELVQHELPAERAVRMTAERVFTTVYPGVLRNRLIVDPPGPDVAFEMFRRDYEDRASGFAEVFPEYVHLDCSAGDTLWLQLFDSAAGQLGRGPMWLRVTGGGEQGSVEFPVTFRPMRFHEDRIWGLYTGELDIEYAAWTALLDD